MPGDWQIYKGVVAEGGRVEVDLFMNRRTTHYPMCFMDRNRHFGPGCTGTQLAKSIAICFYTAVVAANDTMML